MGEPLGDILESKVRNAKEDYDALKNDKRKDT